MANPADEDRLEPEEEGGPVKSFLEHLEDLRWTLIKSASAIGVGFLVCLIAGNHVVAFLKVPLSRAVIPYTDTNQILTLSFGTNRLGEFEIARNEPGATLLGTNTFQNLRIVPTRIVTLTGTNVLLCLEPDTNAPPANGRKLAINLINLNPTDGFMIAFQVAIYGGIALASPFLIYFIGQFVVPALKMKEKKYVLKGFAIGTFLFLLGVSFCYRFLLPVALSASVICSQMYGFSTPNWTAEGYISFVCRFMLGMGLGFEQPVVLLALVKIGILDYAKLKAFRKFMIIINLILGAILTTPEVVTQILLAVPLQILYEVSVWIAWYWERQDRKKQAAENP